MANKIKKDLTKLGYININVVKQETNIVYLINKQYSYNKTTKELKHNEQKIQLTKREIKLLEFIIQNMKKEIISHEDI